MDKDSESLTLPPDVELQISKRKNLKLASEYREVKNRNTDLEQQLKELRAERAEFDGTERRHTETELSREHAELKEEHKTLVRLFSKYVQYVNAKYFVHPDVSERQPFWKDEFALENFTREEIAIIEKLLRG